MPSASGLYELIFKVGNGGEAEMEMLGLVGEGVGKKDFSSLDNYIESELGEKSKEAMGYNVVMLEQTLCKMKCLTTHCYNFKRLR